MATKKESVAVEKAFVENDISKAPPEKPLPQQIIVKEVKPVPVIPKTSGTKFIAGVWYTFIKDEEVLVPPYVKKLLKESRFIYL
jgi:hypothetical protein